MTLNDAISKVFQSLTSVKFFLIILSTWLFYIDKLSESGWLMMVLSVTGLRVMNEMATAYKDIQVAKNAKPVKK